MNCLANITFGDYAKKRGIIETNQYNQEKLKKDIDEEMVLRHLKLISEFHERVMGYNNYISHRLEDKRGRTVEQYKVYIKRVKRYVDSLKQKQVHNHFEKIVLEYGDNFIERANSCISVIYNSGYLELIKRSMDRCEICLGDTNFDNLGKGQYIEVVTLKDCAYDLVELDGIYYLNKLIKRGVNLDYKRLVNKFCEFEQLDKNSVSFMEAILSYPYEFIKCTLKTIKDCKKIEEEKCANKIIKAIELSPYSFM